MSPIVLFTSVFAVGLIQGYVIGQVFGWKKVMIYRQDSIEKKTFEQNEIMMEMLFGNNPITDDELKMLIEKHPEKYGRFANFIGKRK